MRLPAILVCLLLSACGFLPTNAPSSKVSKERACYLAEEFAGGKAILENTRLATLSTINSEVQMPFGSQPSANGLSGNELGYLVYIAASEARPFKSAYGNPPYKTGMAVIHADTGDLLSLRLTP